MRTLAVAAVFFVSFTSVAQQPAPTQLPKGTMRLTTSHCKILVPETWSVQREGKDSVAALGGKMWVTVTEQTMTRSDWAIRKSKTKDRHKRATVLEDSDFLLRLQQTSPTEALRHYVAQFYESGAGTGYVCTANVVVNDVQDLLTLREGADAIIRTLGPTM